MRKSWSWPCDQQKRMDGDGDGENDDWTWEDARGRGRNSPHWVVQYLLRGILFSYNRFVQLIFLRKSLANPAPNPLVRRRKQTALLLLALKPAWGRRTSIWGLAPSSHLFAKGEGQRRWLRALHGGWRKKPALLSPFSKIANVAGSKFLQDTRGEKEREKRGKN